VSVVNTATCNATRLAGCDQTPPSVAVGGGPLGLDVDHRNGTLYVADGNGGMGNTVSMINTATCNAENHLGCGQTPTTVAVGSGPALLAVDQATNTIYVPNSRADTVSMINGATCNATDTSGFADAPTATVGSGAQAVALNPETHTAYVANYNDGTVSVINTVTCNATDSSGCGATLPTVTVGPGPSALVVDPASNTVYVQTGPTGDGSLGLVYMINGATCNATITSSCGQTPRTTRVGSGPIWMAENPATHTVYAVNEEDSSVSMIDAATCNATDSAGCQPVPPALSIGGRSGVTPSYPDYGAGAVAVDPSTDTLYATSQSENNVSVLNGASCNATNTSGCTRFAPTTTVGNGPSAIALDPATHTLYVANQNDQSVSVVNTALCNVSNQAGCARA
jgi:DNA-binding beta-propeller fold protein YncE